MAHNTHTIHADAPTGLMASAAKEVANARPTVVQVVYTAEEKAAKVAAARADFDASFLQLQKSESLNAVSVQAQAIDALALIENEDVRALMAAGLAQQLEKNQAGQRAHVQAMKDALTLMLRYM